MIIKQCTKIDLLVLIISMFPPFVNYKELQAVQSIKKL